MATPKMPSRRTVLKAGAIGTGAVAASCGAAWFFRDQISEVQPAEVAQFLRGNFHYLRLNVSDAQMHKFAADYAKHYQRIGRRQLHRFKGRDASYFDRLMDHLAITFLMSTDFFLNGGDESKPVKYVMLYHPYVSPCWNPILMAAARDDM